MSNISRASAPVHPTGPSIHEDKNRREAPPVNGITLSGVPGAAVHVFNGNEPGFAPALPVIGTASAIASAAAAADPLPPASWQAPVSHALLPNLFGQSDDKSGGISSGVSGPAGISTGPASDELNALSDDDIKKMQPHVLNELPESTLVKLEARVLNLLEVGAIEQLHPCVLNALSEDTLAMLQPHVLNNLCVATIRDLRSRVFNDLSAETIEELHPRVVNALNSQTIEGLDIEVWNGLPANTVEQLEIRTLACISPDNYAQLDHDIIADIRVNLDILATVRHIMWERNVTAEQFSELPVDIIQHISLLSYILNDNEIKALSANTLNNLHEFTLAELTPQVLNGLPASTLQQLQPRVLNNLCAATIRHLQSHVLNGLPVSTLQQLQPRVLNNLCAATIRHLQSRVLNGLSIGTLSQIQPHVAAQLTRIYKELEPATLDHLSKECLAEIVGSVEFLMDNLKNEEFWVAMGFPEVSAEESQNNKAAASVAVSSFEQIATSELPVELQDDHAPPAQPSQTLLSSRRKRKRDEFEGESEGE